VPVEDRSAWERESLALFKATSDMFWLDSGHNGTKCAYATSRKTLAALAETRTRVHVHVTPYQALDPRRPWIEREREQFVDCLRALRKSLEASGIYAQLHFLDDPPTLDMHFAVLDVFSSTDAAVNSI